MKYNITVSGTYDGVKLNDSLCRFVESIYPFLYNNKSSIYCNLMDYLNFVRKDDAEYFELFQKSVEILEDIVETKELYDSDIKKNIDLYLSRDRNLFNIQCLVNNVAFICYDLINTNESYKYVVLKHWFNFITSISYNLSNSTANATFGNSILDVEFSNKCDKNTKYNHTIVYGIVVSILKMYNNTDSLDSSVLEDMYGDYYIINSNNNVDDFICNDNHTNTVSGWVEGAMNEPILC